MERLVPNIRACRLCAERFAATPTGHRPRPVPWFAPGARLRIIGQAPGTRVHETGIPFNDRSGDRLRDWLGLTRDTFYDKTRIAITPMGFCFPGQDAKGSDLPPTKLCADTWGEVVDAVLAPELTLLVGAYAQARYLPGHRTLTETVRDWRDHLPAIVPLPHPSWRNTRWLKQNPWFEAELLPVLKTRVTETLRRC